MRKQDKAHQKLLSDVWGELEDIYQDTSKKIAKEAVKSAQKLSSPFILSDNKKLANMADMATGLVIAKIYTYIFKTNKEARNISRQANEPQATSNHKGFKLINFETKEQTKAIRKLTLSDRVWNVGKGFRQEIEIAVNAAWKSGISAEELARNIQKYLVEPDRYYKRFKVNPENNEFGTDTIWKRRITDPITGETKWINANPNDYKPDRGVYKSSFQNAYRLARTELNRAYREEEWEAWNANPNVKGYTIEISGSRNITVCPLCQDMQGDYPKSFKWLGWHPNCRCVAVPIMDYEVSEMPQQFRDFQEKQKQKEHKKQSKLKYQAYDKDWQKAYFDKNTGGYNVYHNDHQFSKQKGGGEAEKVVGRHLANIGKQVEFLPEQGKGKGKGVPDLSFDNQTWDVKYINKANEETIRKYLKNARKADNVIFYFGESESNQQNMVKVALERETGKYIKLGLMNKIPNVYTISPNGVFAKLNKK